MKSILCVILLLHKLSVADDSFENLNTVLRKHSRTTLAELNLNQTFFSSLENYEVGATPITESQYAWVARVVHSRTADLPHVCTAVCIDQNIFITAARCITGLKVNYTTIVYLYQHLPVKAFVVPRNGTKQSYDDIGFIIVDGEDYQGSWATIQLFDGTNRTDDGYKWFADLNLSYGPIQHKVIGYATQKGIHKIKTADRYYKLTALEVFVSINLCSTILTFDNMINGFYVPCYHSCSLHEYKYKNPKCNNYHGVEGGGVFNMKTNKLLGIATWGPYFHGYNLPVGFSVPNSENFFVDYACAKRVRDDNSLIVTNGYYQNVCDQN